MFKLEVLSPERAHQNLKTPILVKDHLRRAAKLQQTNEKANEDRLA